ncbi:MAG: hypothetical protein ACM358_05475 [Gemmatimonadota bacterium]
MTRIGQRAMSVILCIGLWRTAFAQRPADPLAERLDSATASALGRLIDSVSAQGVPREPLVAKALEGATKGARADVIVAAVQRLASSLAEARSMLGPAATRDELVAGASVLRAGVPGAGLREMRAARRGPLTVPLVVLGDLLARGVPAGKGLTLMTAACRSGVSDQDLLQVRDQVRADIQAGAGPAAAAELRLQGVLRGPSPSVSPIEVRPSGAIAVDNHGDTHLHPALLVQRGSARFAAEAYGTAGGSAPAYRGLHVSAEGSTGVSDRLNGVLTLQASQAVPVLGASQTLFDGTAQLRSRNNDGGASIAAGGRRVTSAPGGALGLYATGGVWRQVGSAHVQVELEYGALPLIETTAQIIDTVPLPPFSADTGRPFLASGTTARVTVVFNGGREQFDMAGGVVHGVGPQARGWVQAMATIRVTPIVALLAGVGNRGPEEYHLGALARFAQLGFRLELPSRVVRPASGAAATPLSAPRFALEARGGARHAFRVWAPAARTVELAGDMTGWASLSLSREISGWWTIEIALAPGLHQLSMRIDGGSWVAPPGLATTGDGYGGLVGVVVID